MSKLANYETRDAIDASLSKQLDSLLIQLKSIIRVGTPYRVYEIRCACPMCGCMLGVVVDDRQYCLRCDDVKWWTQDVRDSVAEVMMGYSEQESKNERKK